MRRVAAVCGAAVAYSSYAQPLLTTSGTAFGVGDGTAGLLVTARLTRPETR